MVLFSVSGLLIQGGAAMIAGLTAFISLTVILLGCLYHYRKQGNQLHFKGDIAKKDGYQQV
jgi:hypothetical protein